MRCILPLLAGVFLIVNSATAQPVELGPPPTLWRLWSARAPMRRCATSTVAERHYILRSEVRSDVHIAVSASSPTATEAATANTSRPTSYTEMPADLVARTVAVAMAT